MTPEGRTRHVKDPARDKGANLFGVASTDRFEGTPEGHRPLDIVPSCQSAMSPGRRFIMGFISEEASGS